MTQPLSIAVLAQRVPYPPNKGEKLRTYHQIKRLVELNHQVSVYTFAESEDDKAYAQQLSDKLGIRVEVNALGSKVLRYAWALFNRQGLSVGAFHSHRMQDVVDSLLSGGCEVMLLSASSLAYYVCSSPAYSARQCRLLVDMMDVDSDKWLQYSNNASWPMTWVYQREFKKIRSLEATANRLFDKTFLIAQEEVNLFHNNVSSHTPVEVLGNGMDFDSFYPPASLSDTVPARYLFTGVMDYKPNVDSVLWFVKSCWPQIIRALPEATFTIAGMNPVAEVKALQSAKGVSVTGFVDEILPCFHEAGVFVAPFRIARGVQNKVLQAAACELPIVTTSMGAEGIAFASEQSMFIADDEMAFSQACIDAVKNPDVARAKAIVALQAMRDTYSWEQQLKPLEEALLTS